MQSFVEVGSGEQQERMSKFMNKLAPLESMDSIFLVTHQWHDICEIVFPKCLHHKDLRQVVPTVLYLVSDPQQNRE